MCKSLWADCDYISPTPVAFVIPLRFQRVDERDGYIYNELLPTYIAYYGPESSWSFKSMHSKVEIKVNTYVTVVLDLEMHSEGTGARVKYSHVTT